MPRPVKEEPRYEVFNSSEKTETFPNWSHDKYFQEMQKALIRELNQRFVDKQANEEEVKNGLEMFRMRNGRWFFAYMCLDGSFGFEYSDECLGVPQWMGWIPESVSFDDALDKSRYVIIDGDKNRLYPIPTWSVPEARANFR